MAFNIPGILGRNRQARAEMVASTYSAAMASDSPIDYMNKASDDTWQQVRDMKQSRKGKESNAPKRSEVRKVTKDALALSPAVNKAYDEAPRPNSFFPERGANGMPLGWDD